MDAHRYAVYTICYDFSELAEPSETFDSPQAAIATAERTRYAAWVLDRDTAETIWTPPPPRVTAASLLIDFVVDSAVGLIALAGLVVWMLCILVARGAR